MRESEESKSGGGPLDAALRLFLAAYPPADAAAEMAGLLKPMRLFGHRPVPVNQIHLTLHFLGNTPISALGSVGRAVDQLSVLPAFELRPLRLMTLPERRSPRLIALETDCPRPLIELRSRAMMLLGAAPEPSFLAHLTLCRFARDARPRSIRLPVSLRPFRVEEVRLVRSLLTGEGARYSTLRTVRLVGADGPPA
ncbi:MAG: RNA 2',3'-cyclic phosphodiesterase [Phycisphaerales bacterium]